jgi:chromatin assembly factor 1 subunit A
VIEDSVRSFNFVPFEKCSKVLTGRNPFRKDEDIIDYEMDSEEEWAEENGEDLEER